MTDLIERPTPPRAPVNSYDPNMESFTDQLYDTIRHDLSSVGKVYDITGTLLYTPRHGMIAEDVQAYVEHPQFRIPVIFDITWDDDAGEVVYHTATGCRFVPQRTGYREGLLSDYEQEIIRKVFSGLDNHPAVDGTRQWRMNDSQSSQSSVALVAGPGAVSTFVSGGAMLVDPTNIIALASVPVMVGVGVMAQRRARKPWKRSYAKLRKNINSWNQNAKGVIMDTLPTKGEQAVFMDALLTLCDHSGVEYRGGLAVSQLGVSEESLGNTSSLMLKIEPHYSMAGSLRIYTILLKGTFSRGAEDINLIFDGTYLYEMENGDESSGRRAAICPL